MKKILIISYKVFFWILFVWNVGIFQYMESLPSQPAIKESSNSAKAFVEMKQWYQVCVIRAKDKAASKEGYSPYDYFCDLKEIQTYCKDNGVGEVPMYFELQVCMEEGLRLKKHSYQEIEVARNIVFPEMNVKPTPINWNKVGTRFLWVYLKMLPFALMLLLLWMYEAYGTMRLKSPISFSISWMLYPITIGVAVFLFWIMVFKEWVDEAYIRKTKRTMLTLFSEDEFALLRRFVEKKISCFGIKIFSSIQMADIVHTVEKNSDFICKGYPSRIEHIPLF